MGIFVTTSGIYLNKTMMDILKVKIKSPVMCFIDRKNNCIGFRNPLSGEEFGAYVINSPHGQENHWRLSCQKKVMAAFSWAKAGTAWKAELRDNMIVVTNKL